MLNGNLLEAIDLRVPLVVDDIIKSYNLVISLHSLQLFPSILVDSVPCINIHPGFNPYNRGFYSQVFSILNSFPIGATIHVMDSGIDSGPIIDQVLLQESSCDTSYSIYRRIIAAEKRLIERNLERILDGTYVSVNSEVKGNYNSKKDFEELCELDLDSQGTLGEHIKLLRALTHPGFDNAFYYCNDGRKHFVSINITNICN